MDTHDTPAPELDAALDALRREMAGIDTPPGVEQELMAAFGARFAPQPRWHRRLTPTDWSMAGSVAAAVLAVMALAQLPQAAPPADATRQVGRDSGGAFIALESLERIAQEPSPRVVEAAVPRTVLGPLGVQVTPENAGDSVLAEMLIAADGQPLALRLSSLN
ncbi:MAG TPA: hypothetical protein VF861_00325 [Telluria sp.]